MLSLSDGAVEIDYHENLYNDLQQGYFYESHTFKRPLFPDADDFEKNDFAPVLKQFIPSTLDFPWYCLIILISFSMILSFLFSVFQHIGLDSSHGVTKSRKAPHSFLQVHSGSSLFLCNGRISVKSSPHIISTSPKSFLAVAGT